MNKRNFLWTLALVALTCLPQGVSAQNEQKVTIDPTAPPVSYAAHQPTVSSQETKSKTVDGFFKIHRHRTGGYSAPAKLQLENRSGLNDLLRKHEPIHIDAAKVRRAVQAKKKAPFIPDNNHTHLITNIAYNTVDLTKELGLFALDVVTGEITCLFTGFEDYENYGFNGGAYIWNGKYRGVYYEQGTTATSSSPATVMDFNMDDWSLVEPLGENPYHTSMALECGTEYHADGTTSVVGQFWGVNGKGDLSLRYATLDPNGLTTTKFGQTPTKQMLAMGVTNDGRLYGVAKDGNLYRIDRQSGEEILIGHTGVDDLMDYEGFFYLQGGEIDPRDNTFYWVADHANIEKSELYSVNLETGKATVLIDFAGDVECTGVVIAPQQRKNETPAAVTDLTAAFGTLETTGSGSFTAPTTTYGGQQLATDAQLFYHIFVNDVKQTLTGNQTTPGTKVSFNIASTNVKNNAENTIKVTISLGENGEESLSASTTAWAGYGIPEAPKNVSMTFDEATNTATITWEAPAKGDNAGVKGGKVDMVSYFVYRVVDGDRMNNIHNNIGLNDDVRSITYTLTEDDKNMTLADLSFAVEAWAAPMYVPLQSLASEAATTNSITIGRGKDIPYFVDFAYDYYNVRQKDFTILNCNNDSRCWVFCPPHVSLGTDLCGAVACANYDGNTPMDDWLITPGLALEAGKTYHYKSNMHGPGANVPYYEYIEVKAGTDKTAEAMTIDIVKHALVEDYCVIEGFFTVPEDGNYYIGLHSVSEGDNWEIAVFDISVAEKGETEADELSPVAGQISVTPIYGTVQDANNIWCGSADVKVTLPNRRLDGTVLSTTDKLNVTLTVTKDGETTTLAEYTGQSRSATLTYKAENLPSGEYTFGMVTSYDVEGTTHYSPVATTVGYVGWDDKPAAPSGMKAVQRGDKLYISFPTLTEIHGAHDAYLPSVTYRAYTPSHASQIAYYVSLGYDYIYEMEQDGKPEGDEIFVPNFSASEGGQYNWNWYVIAVSKDANGKNIYSELVPISSVLGEPMPAPVMETGDQEFVLDADLSPELNEIWNYWNQRATSVAGIQPIEDQFGSGVGKSWNMYSAFNGDFTAVFRKVDISALTTPVLDFDIILEDPDVSMEIVLKGPEGKEASYPQTVMDGIQHISIPLNQHLSWGWVQPNLKLTFHIAQEGDRIHDIFFDNFGIYDKMLRNLTVTSIDAPANMKAGEEGIANVTVMNMGQQDISSYTVTLTQDEAVLGSQNITRRLKPGDFRTVQFRFRANTVTDYDRSGQEEAEKVLMATVETEGDVFLDDNVAEAIVTIAVEGGKHNSYPSNVTAQQTDGSSSVDVAWSFDFEKTSQRITESFEDYELWSTGGVKSGAPEGQIGPWRLYDGDGKYTYTWKNFEYVTENAGEPQAYQVFNGTILKSTSDYYYYDFTPVSGEQYLVSMDPADGNYIPLPDDWLISPPVRGGSTVEFYYGSLVRKPQGVDLWYSETGQDVSDFKLLQTFEESTGEDWFLALATLPETAKYFAIHHCSSSNLGYGLRIDDVTYNMLTSVDHFNIYVDGRLVGTSTEAAYTISEALEDGQHKVAITAVYADGTESVPAYATLNYQSTGIHELMASGKVFDVYTTDGKLVRKQTRSINGLKGVFVINNQKVVLK